MKLFKIFQVLGLGSLMGVAALAQAQVNANAAFQYQSGGAQAYGGGQYMAQGGGGYQMPQGSLQAINPGAAQYAHSVGPGEQPAYYQGSAGVNCVPRGYASPIEGPISNGAPVVIGGGSSHN